MDVPVQVFTCSDIFSCFFYTCIESPSLFMDPPRVTARIEVPSQFTDIFRIIKICEQCGVTPFTQEGSFFINALNLKKTLATEALLRRLTNDVKILQERLGVVQQVEPRPTQCSVDFPQLGPLITSLEEADLLEKKLRDPAFMESVVDVLSKEGNHPDKMFLLSKWNNDFEHLHRLHMLHKCFY